MFSAVDLNIFNTCILNLVAWFAVSINDADAVKFPTVLFGARLRHRTAGISREFLDTPVE